MSIRERINAELDSALPEQLPGVLLAIRRQKLLAKPVRYSRVSDIPMIFTPEQGEELIRIIDKEFNKIEGEW